MLKYIGIDLGQKGAIAVQTKFPFKKPKLELIPFWQHHSGTRLRPPTDDELFEYVKEACQGAGEVHVTVEHPIFIRGKSTQKTIASLSQNFGFIIGVLTTLEVASIWTPMPVQWKKATGFHGDDKKKMLQLAQKLFKHKFLTEVTADAVLISEACRLRFK